MMMAGLAPDLALTISDHSPRPDIGLGAGSPSPYWTTMSRRHGVCRWTVGLTSPAGRQQ